MRPSVTARPGAGASRDAGQPSKSMATTSTAVMTHPQAALIAAGCQCARSRSARYVSTPPPSTMALPPTRRRERWVSPATGQPRHPMKNSACHTPTAMSAAPKSGAAMGPPGFRSPAAARSAAGTASTLTIRKYAAIATAHETASAAMPERSRPSPRSGQPSHTSDSCSIAANTAPASAKVAGNVAGTPGPGRAWKIPRRSDRSTMAWPAIVSTTAATITSAVSIRPDQGVLSLAPGQSVHQNATMATAGSANVASGPRTSSDDSMCPVPSARAKKTAAPNRRPARPSRGCAARPQGGRPT